MGLPELYQMFLSALWQMGMRWKCPRVWKIPSHRITPSFFIPSTISDAIYLGGTQEFLKDEERSVYLVHIIQICGFPDLCSSLLSSSFCHLTVNEQLQLREGGNRTYSGKHASQFSLLTCFCKVLMEWGGTSGGSREKILCARKCHSFLSDVLLPVKRLLSWAVSAL